MHFKYFIAFLFVLFYTIAFSQPYVYTCKGGTVDAFTRAEELSYWQIQDERTQVQNQWGPLGVTVIGDATTQYNCHAYAWHLRGGNTNRVWINNAFSPSGGCFPQTHNIDKYWTDGCFIQVCNESEADKVHYYCGDHSAAASVTNPGLWESKWGASCLVRHSRTAVPYAQASTSVNFYASTKISGSATVCPNGMGSFSVKNISGATYTWTCSSSVSAISGANTNQFTVRGNGGGGSAWVQVQITTPCSSIPATSRMDFALAAPPISFTYSPSGPCNGTWQTWYINMTAPNGSNWYWYADYTPGSSFNIYSPYSPSTYVSVSGGGGIRLSYTDLCGVQRLDGVTIWSSCRNYYRIGPNPARSVVTVSTESAKNALGLTSAFSEVNVYNTEGTLKKHFLFKRAKNASLNVSDLPLGVYVIEIVDGNFKEKKMLQIIK